MKNKTEADDRFVTSLHEPSSSSSSSSAYSFSLVPQNHYNTTPVTIIIIDGQKISMSSSSFINSRILSRQAVVWMGSVAALSSIADAWVWPHHDSRPTTMTTRLQSEEAATSKNTNSTESDSDGNNNDNNKMPMYPDLRPARLRWTWSSLLGMWSSDWRTQMQKLQDDLERHDYRAMPDPVSVMVPSHAIAGALLKEHYIEAYRIYQKQQSEGNDEAHPGMGTTTAQRTDRAAQATEPQVVGLVRVGTQVDGHEGIVHGGIIAMLVDDVLGYGFYSIGWPAAFTANLSVDYRQPVPAATLLRIECYFQRRERRKLYWTVRVVDARRRNVVYAEASCLYVVPKRIYEQVRQQDEAILEKANSNVGNKGGDSS